MDVRRLIDEVRSRPVLWDNNHPKYKCYFTTAKQWNEIARILNVNNSEECKRKWKNIRDTYRTCLNNEERQKEKSKALGTNTNYASNWTYIKEMDFLKDFVRLRKNGNKRVSKGFKSKNNSQNFNMETDNGMTDDGNYSLEDEYDGIIDLDDSDNLQELLAIKKEFEDTTTTLTEVNTSKETNTTAYSDIENYLPKFEETRTTTTTTSTNNNIQNCLTTLNLPASIKVKIVPKNSKESQKPPPPLTDNNNRTEQPLSRPQEQRQQQQPQMQQQQRIHFLRDLEREEEKLIQSTQEDIKSTTTHLDAEDPDRNFLLSFLPHMKKMNDLQNLQFRSQMSQMILNVLLPPPTSTNVATTSQTALPPLTPNPHLVRGTNNVTSYR
ncbi:myb-like protein Q [Musca domestica]|uniref:Myb-like protein Q n=1 Tax=Musca domestica TaxID=7370 RepID=A0ABM3V7Y7_MUSDO|nr:myb-like protein Q [Musca domestica]